MENFKLIGEFLKFYGRLPENSKELAEFVLFGIKNNKK